MRTRIFDFRGLHHGEDMGAPRKQKGFDHGSPSRVSPGESRSEFLFSGKPRRKPLKCSLVIRFFALPLWESGPFSSPLCPLYFFEDHPSLAPNCLICSIPERDVRLIC